MSKHSVRESIDNEPALDIKGLSVAFAGETGAVRAITDVDICVQRGEARGLVGESGSGKSTVARAIVGLLGRSGRVVDGSIKIGGRDTTGFNDKQRALLARTDVSIIFQDPLNALDPLRTIYSQIADTFRLRLGRGAGSRRRDFRKQAAELLERVEIRNPEDVLRRYPHELSGGMQQRVVIGMAVIGEPRLIIADEPSTALDVVTQNQVVDIMHRLVRETSAGLLFITHNLALTSQICDTISVMYAGKVIEHGACLDVVRAPAHPYTQGLVDAVPNLTGPMVPVQGIPGSPPAQLGEWFGCAFKPRCYLGHERARCQDETPRLRSDNVVPRSVRCHFAQESVAHRLRGLADQGMDGK